MLELRDFQQHASDLIVERFRRYTADPPLRGPRSTQRRVPFFQALSSITASGKTVILADAVQAMAVELATAPVVLWLSKGKVVVQQTNANLAPGGKYHHLIGDASVDWLAAYDVDAIHDAADPLIYVATVGTFNQRDRETSDLLVYKSEVDTQDTSTWNALKVRTNAGGLRRPLLIVYDEGHNLSDQQTDLLLELEPDALVVASATMKLPPKLASEITHLREAGWSHGDLVTEVDPAAVAQSGLIKARVLLAGYEAPMEETVTALLDDLQDATATCEALSLDWRPKAIYVCKTNIVEGDAYRRDDPKQPFSNREAPPILIWRYLVEVCSIDPDQIAVYCNLKVTKEFPAPPDFHLYSGGDRDYDEFVGGDYRHVIFNKGLQEGWDDPSVFFAYIDKSMESDVAVEQLVGRLLRQPEAHHQPADRLNTAHLYVRLDRRNTFRDVVDEVTAKLGADTHGMIQLLTSPPGRPKPTTLQPRTVRTVHTTDLDTRTAVEPVRQIIGNLTDYRNDDGTNTHATGSRVLVQRNVGNTGEADFEWEEFEHTNLVSVRWLFQREVRRRYPGALGVAETDHPKFDALVGFGSTAYEQVLRTADDVVAAYTDNVLLVQPKPNPYRVGPVLVRPDDLKSFTNALHEGYSDLNSEELACARELDATGYDWCRNPPRSGYGIPLVTIGRTRIFYPDFLIWTGGDDADVVAIDTTGAHLLADKTGRKMLIIRPPRGSQRQLNIRFISRGRHDPDLTHLDDEGFTVWGRRTADGTLRTHHTTELRDAVTRSLQPM